jgi:hypothetical protein
VASAASSLLLHAGLLIAITSTVSTERRAEPDAVTVDLIASVIPLANSAMQEAIPRASLQLKDPSPETLVLPVIPPPEIEPIAADSFEEGSESDAFDAEELARLQSLYAGQIQGRIGRALEALVAHGSPIPSCRAQVIQDERGRVADVDLSGCPVPGEQKQLLLAALRRASPLPRPPAGLAMGSFLTLDLKGLKL